MMTEMPERTSPRTQTEIQRMLASEPHYARSWHRQLVYYALVEGVEWPKANCIATRFMRWVSQEKQS